jgi:peptidoglycan L-alanyl-D-glutamate endopeptidase CwlK
VPTFSDKSLQKLETCDHHLQILFTEVVKHYDCTVLYGHRSPDEQFEIYKQGRELINGVWVIADKSKIVTNCDGYKIKSNHNKLPSKAVDVAPYVNGVCFEPKQVYYFAGVVTGIAICMNLRDKIRGGCDWDGDNDIGDQVFNDLLHWEII